MSVRPQHLTLLLLSTALLCGCGLSVGVVGVPMGGMGMPVGGFAYGGSWGHSTNVYAYNRTTDVYAANRNNHVYVNDEHVNNAFGNHGGTFYHPGRVR